MAPNLTKVIQAIAIQWRLYFPTSCRLSKAREGPHSNQSTWFWRV